ncbi:hypothetical protein F4779DRAFT_215429 [Xylariaceae sp. FL0662B]|nr:hypothetical protein F4779DRAFT_215429 [Xylariaceae sp. FL0662B]
MFSYHQVAVATLWIMNCDAAVFRVSFHEILSRIYNVTTIETFACDLSPNSPSSPRIDGMKVQVRIRLLDDSQPNPGRLTPPGSHRLTEEIVTINWSEHTTTNPFYQGGNQGLTKACQPSLDTLNSGDRWTLMAIAWY